MQETRQTALLGGGALLAAIGASLCCILPIAVALMGVGSAALGARLEPYRPWFAGLTIAFLGFAFYRAYRPERCGPGESCAPPSRRRRQRVLLWVVAVIALALIAFPYYAPWLW